MSVSASISRTSTLTKEKGRERANFFWLKTIEDSRKTAAETMPIQCSEARARVTTFPANSRVGSTPKTVGARTKAKKTMPPIQTTRDNQIRIFQMSMASTQERERPAQFHEGWFRP